MDGGNLNFDTSTSLSAAAANLGAFDNWPIARRLSQLFIDTISDEATRADLHQLFTNTALSDRTAKAIPLYDQAYAISRRRQTAQEHAEFDAYFGKIAYLINLAGTICDRNITNEMQKRTDLALASYNSNDPDAQLPHLRRDQVLRYSMESFLFPSDWVKPVPGVNQIHEMSADESITLFAQSTAEDVSTMHPNGSTTLETAVKLDTIYHSVINFVADPSVENHDQLVLTLQNFSNPEFSITPTITEGPKKGQIRQSTVAEEGAMALYYAKKDLAAHRQVYQRADTVWKKRHGEAYGLQQRQQIAFNRIFATWAGGNDVDGSTFKAAVLMLETFIKENLEFGENQSRFP